MWRVTGAADRFAFFLVIEVLATDGASLLLPLSSDSSNEWTRFCNAAFRTTRRLAGPSSSLSESNGLLAPSNTLAGATTAAVAGLAADIAGEVVDDENVGDADVASNFAASANGFSAIGLAEVAPAFSCPEPGDAKSFFF